MELVIFAQAPEQMSGFGNIWPKTIVVNTFFFLNIYN